PWRGRATPASTTPTSTRSWPRTTPQPVAPTRPGRRRAVRWNSSPTATRSVPSGCAHSRAEIEDHSFQGRSDRPSRAILRRSQSRSSKGEHQMDHPTQGSFEDQNMVRLEVMRLRHQDAHLKRRHDALIERVAAFPNAVNTRQEKEVAAERTAVA